MVWIGLPAPSCSRCLCPDGRTIRHDLETSQPNSGTEDLIPVNNPLERIMREIRRRTRVVGAFPDGQSCLNLAAARLRYIAGTAWSAKCYMNMKPLYQPQVMQTEPSPDQMCEKSARYHHGQVAAVTERTLRTTPVHATHWSIRSMAGKLAFPTLGPPAPYLFVRKILYSSPATLTRGIKPVIPPKSNRTATIRYNKRLYGQRKYASSARSDI